jgi:hypothetical protein
LIIQWSVTVIPDLSEADLNLHIFKGQIMSFTSDQKALRTVDYERELELKVRSGGSDGTKSFQLVSTGDAKQALAGFSARLEPRPLAAYEQENMPGIEEIATWKVMCPNEPGLPLPNYTIEQTIDVIKDALLSYKGVHGMGFDKTKFTVEISKLIENLTI